MINLTDQEKYRIQKLVLKYCPRVTDEEAEQWGLFTTPEADDVRVFHHDVAYIKMAMEIIKDAAETGFDAMDGQEYARKYV